MNARQAPITELLLRAVYTGASAAASSAANCFNRSYLTTRLNKSRIYVATYGCHGTMTVLAKRSMVMLDRSTNKDCKMSEIHKGTRSVVANNFTIPLWNLITRDKTAK